MWIDTTMWMRDAVRTGRLPSFRDLENPRYFPYAGVSPSGPTSVGRTAMTSSARLLRAAGRSGNVQAALEQMTHRPAEQSIADWHRRADRRGQADRGRDRNAAAADRAQRDQHG